MKIINMATYTITTQANSVDITKDGETREYPFNELIVQVDDLDVDTLTLFNKRSLIIDYYIYTTTDTIDVNGVTVFADAAALKIEIDAAIFNSGGGGSAVGDVLYQNLYQLQDDENSRVAFVDSKIQQYLRANSGEVITRDEFEALTEYEDKTYVVVGWGSYFGSRIISYEPFTYDVSDLHVMKTGNDTTGDGSFGNPYLTIGKAISVVGAAGGLNIWVHEGKYEENVSGLNYLYIENKNYTSEVRICAVPGDKVELAPTGAGTYIYRLAGTCGNITLQGFVMNSTASSTGIYTHTGTSVANNCKILDCIINDYNNITLSIAADGNPTTGFQVKRNSMYSTGDFSTYFRNCLDLDFIGNIFRADGTGVVRGFRSDVGCGGTMNINSNTMFGKNSLTGWILDVLAVIDDAGAIVNINGNTIDAGSRAIQVTGGTVTNSIELNIKGNYIKDLDSTIDAKEYIDGGVCEYNVIESDSNVGIGLPSDYTFTGGYSLRNMTIRYNKIRATKAAAHGILFGELSSGNNCYDNIIDVSGTGRHAIVIKGDSHIVNNNMMYGGVLDGVYLKGATNCVITNNFIKQDTGGSCIRYANDGSGVTPEGNNVSNNKARLSNGQVIEVLTSEFGTNNVQNNNYYNITGAGTWGQMFMSLVTSLDSVKASWLANYPTGNTNDNESKTII
jgi:hypothetical protein